MATLASLWALPLSSRKPLPSSQTSLFQTRLSLVRKHSSFIQLPDRTNLSLLTPKCSTQDTDSKEPEPIPSSSPKDLAYKLCIALGGIGFVETSYLTFLKLTNSTAFCPVGAGTCSDVLSSDYAVVFGVPLPLIGMIAYGLVATLGLQLSRKSLPFGLFQSDGRQILLWTSTSMAAASAYFLYILTTKFTGTSCSYCLLSALLSFSVFFIALKDFGFEAIKKEVGLQLCIAGLVLVTLNSAYSAYRPVPPSLDEVDIPYFATEITTTSSPYAISLAKHLSSINAKMYGAFWCSHCVEQKEMFGREASKKLNYVECFPNGFKKGTKMQKECSDVGIEGFPTWVINGKVLNGELDFLDLAEASGFISDTVTQSPAIVD